MPRSSIIVYNVELTDGQRINQVTKTSIVRALESHPDVYGLLPPSWTETKKRVKRKSRKR